MEFVLNSIDQSGPRGLDDVFAHTDGVPGVVLIGAFDVHSDSCCGSCFSVDDPDFVVDKLHRLDVWEKPYQRFAQRSVHGVDRSMAFGRFDANTLPDFQLQDRLCVLLVS